MAPEKKVADASVVAKWFLNEPGSDNALSLKDDHVSGRITIVVPELLFLEVVNALRFKGGTLESLSSVNKILWQIQLKVEKLSTFLLDKAIENSLKHNISLYDAIYVALANFHGARLITADKELKGIPCVEILGGVLGHDTCHDLIQQKK